MPFDGAGYIAGECLQKIDAVIDLIGKPDTWCKGTLRSGDGRYCLRGAILAAHAGLLEAPILQAINDVTGRRYRRIESFNDHAQTDHRLVNAVLLRTRDNIMAGQAAATPRASLDNLYAQGMWKLMRLRDGIGAWFKRSL